MTPEELRDRYDAGATTAELEEETGLNHRQMLDALRQAGTVMRPRQPRMFPAPAEMIAAYERGTPLADVGKPWGIGRDQAKRMLLDAGVTIRPRGRPPKRAVTASPPETTPDPHPHPSRGGPMRQIVLPVLAAFCVATIASCSSTPPDPKTEWTNAMRDAGFAPNAPHTFDEMFESAKQFCGAGSALTITGLARTALNPEQADTTAMPARGKDPDQAATAYGNATWKWACGHQQ